MAKLFSKEFTIDGIPYLLESGCPNDIWPNLCDRVQKDLIRIGKEAAKSMYSEATAVGMTKFGSGLVSFKLTINPQGNNFR
jgi:hypothetical protein